MRDCKSLTGTCHGTIQRDEVSPCYRAFRFKGTAEKPFTRCGNYAIRPQIVKCKDRAKLLYVWGDHWSLHVPLVGRDALPWKAMNSGRAVCSGIEPSNPHPAGPGQYRCLRIGSKVPASYRPPLIAHSSTSTRRKWRLLSSRLASSFESKVLGDRAGLCAHGLLC